MPDNWLASKWEFLVANCEHPSRRIACSDRPYHHLFRLFDGPNVPFGS